MNETVTQRLFDPYLQLFLSALSIILILSHSFDRPFINSHFSFLEPNSPYLPRLHFVFPAPAFHHGAYQKHLRQS